MSTFLAWKNNPKQPQIYFRGGYVEYGEYVCYII